MLEQDNKSEENRNLGPAKAGHSSNIRLASRNALVLHKLQTRLARGWFEGRGLGTKEQNSRHDCSEDVLFRVIQPRSRRARDCREEWASTVFHAE